MSEATTSEIAAIRMGFRADLAHAIELSCLEFGIDSLLRRAHYLGQLAHETNTGLWLEEIASGKAYEGRTDLGNTQPGDGVRFKGRGLIQLTGRDNYTKYSKYRYGDNRLVSNPYLVATIPECAYASGWFWSVLKKLNSYADNDDILTITRRINGGTNGLQDRIEKVDLAKKCIGLTK